MRKFYCCNRGNDLSSERAGFSEGGSERDERFLLDLALGNGVKGQPSICGLGLSRSILDRDVKMLAGRETTRLRTRADNAFLRASAAALRMCSWELSLASSAESMAMYAGWIGVSMGGPVVLAGQETYVVLS